jgi:cytochrome c-type biogenesis protein CcmH/NrfG
VRPAAAREAAAATRSLAEMRRKLSSTGRGPALDPKAAALEAERAFRQGLALLQQSALPGALRAFGRACALRGEEPEYRMYEAWTEVLAARDDEIRAIARAKAAACAQRLLARDTDSVRAHAILGQIAIANGDLDRAEQHFRAALRRQPEDRDALRGLRLIERRRSSGRGTR